MHRFCIKTKSAETCFGLDRTSIVKYILCFMRSVELWSKCVEWFRKSDVNQLLLTMNLDLFFYSTSCRFNCVLIEIKMQPTGKFNTRSLQASLQESSSPLTFTFRVQKRVFPIYLPSSCNTSSQNCSAMHEKRQFRKSFGVVRSRNRLELKQKYFYSHVKSTIITI
jgi:hypothetical protein